MSRRTKIALILLGLFGLGLLLFFGVMSWFVVEVTAPDAAAVPTVDSEQTARAPEPRGVQEPFVVSGRVVFQGGEPAPGIEMRLQGEGPRQRQDTDADGHFRFEAGGPVTLQPDSDLSRPWRLELDGPTEEILFTIPPRCPIDVLVVNEADEPVEGAEVRARATDGALMSRRSDRVETDATGRARLPDLSCSVVELTAEADGYPSVRRRSLDVESVSEVKLRLKPGIVVSGTVSGTDGKLLEDASLRAGQASATSDEEGRYELLVVQHTFRGVRASKDGYRDHKERLRIASDDAGPVPLDLVLEPARRVTVFCKGLPDDSCSSVEAMSCTRTWVPWGSICSGEPTVCDCPWGNAAVRGGGATAMVLPGVDEVWLDMTNSGGVSGLVTLDDEPSPCEVIASRLPESLTDIKHGLAAIRRTSCTPGGSFGLRGLSEGGWSIEIKSGDISHRITRTEVLDTMVDLGTIALDGGGEIHGIVRDGLTGDPEPGEVVVAVMKLDDPKAPPPMGQAFSGAGGRFRIRGLEDGPYEVILASKPMDKVEIDVVDGEGARELELETGGGGLLERQGFEVETDSDGSLVISDVDADGLGAAAGLLPGDRIAGVTIMGMEISQQVPELADLITDFVLDRFGGAVGLIVERDGERVKIDLD